MRVGVRRLEVPGSAEVPQVRLIDAQAEGLDPEGLRRRARLLAAASGAACVSRAYRYPYALIAWHSGSVGIDIERIEPVDEVFASSICTPVERRTLTTLDGAGVAALWCGKEALAKALGDAVAYDPRRLAAPIGWPNLSAGSWRAAELPAPEQHTAWVCWRAAGDRGEPS